MKILLFIILLSYIHSRPIKLDDWKLKPELIEKIVSKTKNFSSHTYLKSIIKMKEPFLIIEQEFPKLFNDKGIDLNFCTMQEIIDLLEDLSEIIDDQKEFFYYLPRYIKKFWIAKSSKPENVSREIGLTKIYLNDVKEEELENIKSYKSSEGIFSQMLICRFPISDNEWGQFFHDEERFKIAITEIIKERNKKAKTDNQLDDDEQPYMSPIETTTIEIYELTERVQSYLYNMEYNIFLPIYMSIFQEILYNNYEEWSDDQIYDYIQFMSAIFMKEIQFYQIFYKNLRIDLEKNQKMFFKEVNKIGIFKNIDEEIFPLRNFFEIFKILGIVFLIFV